MNHEIFYQLSSVIAIAAALALVARLLRQPLIIAYIITGIVAGPSVFNLIQDHSAFESFSQIGIALLLFIIGLGLNVGIIKTTGKPVAFAFLTILIGIGFLGLIISTLFGFTNTESLIVATALLFSSTIIIIKSLTDKREQSRLYGRIAIGVLLVEDILATLVLVFISASANSGGAINDILLLLVKGAGLGAILILIGGYIMPRLSKLFASSQELLYVFAIAWAFGVAAVFDMAGFSIEVGALFAGVALASLPYVQAIETRLKPLRDFFLVLFFIGLGEGLRIDGIREAIVPALAFSAMILVAKPVLFMSSLGVLGYTKQTSFKAGVHMSQISEFSIIIVALAATSGLVSNQMITIITLTTLITITVSSYLMKYDDELYQRFQKFLSIFERSTTKKELKSLRHYPLVLLGYQQGGSTFVRAFRKMKKPFIVVDYNPDVIDNLRHQHINHMYGDASDLELLNEIDIHHSEMVISTINDAATNCMLAEHITKANPQAVFICHAARLNDAEALYKAGATYVMMPQNIGDQNIDDFLVNNGINKSAFTKYRHDHLINLGGIAVKA